MAVTASWYGKALEGQWGTTSARRVDWVTDTVKQGLTTASYTPDVDNHDFYNDITNELPTAGGYTLGGVTLGTKSATYNTASNELRLDAADPSWSGATFTARRSFTYVDTAGASSADPLICYIDFGQDESVSAGVFTIVLDSTGLAKITVT